MNPAAAAVTLVAGNSVTWDPSGPTYDEPKPPVAQDAGATPSKGGPTVERVKHNKFHPGFIIQESESDDDGNCAS